MCDTAAISIPPPHTPPCAILRQYVATELPLSHSTQSLSGESEISRLGLDSMKAAILGSHQGATVVSRQAAGADGQDLLSPTARQLHKLNQFFKGGHITKAQKDELKMHILEASTDSL